MIRNIIQKLILIAMISVPLAACGVKPNSVSPPEGAENEQYPRTYPTSVEQ